jgi:hypothetical protein
VRFLIIKKYIFYYHTFFYFIFTKKGGFLWTTKEIGDGRLRIKKKIRKMRFLFKKHLV